MAYAKTNRTKKISIQVNEGTEASPTLKNRIIGNAYWISPNSTNAQCYQLAQYFANLQAHTLNAVIGEDKADIIEE